MQADMRTIDSAVAIAIAQGNTLVAIADISADTTDFAKAVQANLSGYANLKPPTGAWKTQKNSGAAAPATEYKVDATSGRAMVNTFTSDTL